MGTWGGVHHGQLELLPLKGYGGPEYYTGPPYPFIGNNSNCPCGGGCVLSCLAVVGLHPNQTNVCVCKSTDHSDLRKGLIIIIDNNINIINE